MEEKEQWNLKDIFKKEEEYEQEVKQLKENLEKLKQYQGILRESSQNIYNCYNLYEKAVEKYEKIYAYGMLKFHLNMADSENIKLYKRCEAIGTEFSKTVSFITPEITDIDTEKLLKYIEENEQIKRYERELREIIKEKEHILSKEEENILASYSEVFSATENAFDILTNTEFKFGNIIDENGNETEMTDSNYTVFLKSKNENIRKQAFNLMYKKYKEFLNTIGELYITRVKQDTITAKLRKYKSSLEKAVEHDDSNLKVYNALIEAVNQEMQANHEFIKIKKELLKKDEMHIYDLYVNPIEAQEAKVTFEEAKKEVLDALEVLGEEYTNKLKEAFENRWIDVYPKENKRGGAYSMGVYGVHPYVLDNFVGDRRDISTIAHELGHSMHSYYSNKTQNVIDANYTIMIAEIASTTNEIILAKHQIENEKDKTKKAEIIYELLEMIRATLFRQAMFAEFEKEVHQKIEEDEMLSAEDLSNLYYDLNKKYFGEHCVIDEQIKYEWARIPHFYSPFYVYKYATGVSAAIIIATNILNKKEGYVEKYIEMLKQGCTKKAVELLKMVNVDLEDINTYKGAIDFYRDLSKELYSICK
ncbi:MAG: oligoendopeptidase F [Clostridia bacterium]|nr:oligoendopeptidase F [Clostridia bacterium]